jgi:hypothetical protein
MLLRVARVPQKIMLKIIVIKVWGGKPKLLLADPVDPSIPAE